MSNSLLASSSNFPLISSSSLVSLTDSSNNLSSNGIIKVTFNNFTKHVRIDEGLTAQVLIDRILAKIPSCPSPSASLSSIMISGTSGTEICDERGEKIPLGLYTVNGDLLRNDQEILAIMSELHIKPVGIPFKISIMTISSSSLDSQAINPSGKANDENGGEIVERNIYIDQDTTVGQCLSKLKITPSFSPSDSVSSEVESKVKMIKSAMIEGEKKEIALFDEDILLLEQMDEINGRRISYSFIVQIISPIASSNGKSQLTEHEEGSSSACKRSSKITKESIDLSGCYDCHTKDIAFISMTLGRKYCSKCSIKAIRWQSLSRAVPLRIRPLKFFKASSDITAIVKLLEQVPCSLSNSCSNGNAAIMNNNSDNINDHEATLNVDLESLYEEIEFHTDQRIRMLIDSTFRSNNNFDIDQLLYNEGTLMHLAAYHGDGPMTELLIMLGANPFILNRRNQKPSEIGKGEKIRNKIREYELLYKVMMEHLPRLRCDVDGCIATITNSIIQGNIQYNVNGMNTGNGGVNIERNARRIITSTETSQSPPSSSLSAPCTTTGCSRERFLELLQDIYGQIEYRIYGLKINEEKMGMGNMEINGKRNKLNGMEDEQFGELVCLTLQELKLREDIAIFLSRQNAQDQLASP